jgi:hypothetical protein
METAQQLRDKFQADLKALQASCTHPEVTDWIEEQWAPGHSVGTKVKVCLVCEKVIERNGLDNVVGYTYG